MKTSIEIEFKTLINEDVYNELLKEFDLEANVFHQINYYFDNDDFFLKNNKMALRIRNKGTNFKFTLKAPFEGNIREDSIFITKDEALDYIENGVDLNSLYSFDIFAKVQAYQETYRAVTPYKGGKLFIDKSIYYGKVDYEIEYEVDEKEDGLKEFYQFLKERNIPLVKTMHKIDRTYLEKGIE